MIYSADKEGKSGGTVSRISKDYGATWTESVTISENKIFFGLSVAPYSSYVAFFTHTKLSLWKYVYVNEDDEFQWHQQGNTLNLSDPNTQTQNNTKGVSVIFKDPLVSVAFVNCQKKLKIKNYSTSTSKWTDVFTGKNYNNDTAWLCNDFDTAKKLFLAVKRSNVGVRTTSNQTDYSSFNNWTDQGKFPVSGIWVCPYTYRMYILSTDNQNVVGNSKYDEQIVLYKSNQNSSMQRRVSMFNVPAKQ
jgi:hypothetical protein